ncbi:hypothetical protein OG814_08225 [Streptomyces zaomyceticus]|uniref:Uncharacterized protein n=1 Tax=Streptomyces zaomyceticus TaxID=68286 RepID=A0ABZ1L876_9ACTN
MHARRGGVCGRAVYEDEAEDATADEVRALLRDWLPDTRPEDGDPLAGTATGLDVPEATASEVTRVLARLLGPVSPVVPAPRETLLIARALVVDEHPSAGVWSEGERRAVIRLVAVLLVRHGEEGVESFVRALRGDD